MSAPATSRAVHTVPPGRRAAQASARTDTTSRHQQPDHVETCASGPHRLYVAIDAIAQTEWSDRDEFEAQVLQTERQIEVHLNEIILESVSLLKKVRADYDNMDEPSADQTALVIACEAVRDRALEKRQDLLEELELAVDAGRRFISHAFVSQ